MRSGESTTINASHEKADKGWVGIAPGDEGLWAAVECAGEVEVVRIDIGIDDTLRWCKRHMRPKRMTAADFQMCKVHQCPPCIV